MKPSIGRIVHFAFGTSEEEKFWVPAVVTRVHNATCVNLRAFGDDSCNSTWHTSVCQGEDVGSWRWPPRVGE